MYKAKLCGIAIVCMVGFVGINPITAFAAETTTESVTLSEKNNNQKEKKAAIEEKMKAACEKWNSLTSKQKDEVYALVENQMQAKNKIMDKLVEYGVIEQEDAAILKSHFQEKFSKSKESGEFPLLRHKGNKHCK